MALLEIRNLSMRFGGLTAVSDFDVTFEGGELAGLIGPNGAGKTTVFNVTSGFYKPTQGSVVFKGRDTRGLKPHKVTALGVARTFQNIRLWNQLSVLDNIRIAQHYRMGYSLMDCFLRTRRYGRAEAKIDSIAWQLLEQLDLKRWAQEKPSNLSYGLQRRLEIARALSVQPDLLLLDEPAAGMNPQETDELKRLVVRIREEDKLSILLIEHDMKMVMSLSDRVYVMEYGKKIAEGTPREVRANPRVIQAYLGEEEHA